MVRIPNADNGNNDERDHIRPRTCGGQRRSENILHYSLQCASPIMVYVSYIISLPQGACGRYVAKHRQGKRDVSVEHGEEKRTDHLVRGIRGRDSLSYVQRMADKG